MQGINGRKIRGTCGRVKVIEGRDLVDGRSVLVPLSLEDGSAHEGLRLVPRRARI